MPYGLYYQETPNEKINKCYPPLNFLGCHPVGGVAAAQDLIQNDEILCSRCTPHRMTSGFTLVELSIVLVIIGLVIGGIFVGQDLIKAAQIRQQITQLQNLETEINTFKVKYNCLPGDCANATDFFGTSFDGMLVANGNGDGFIMSTIGGNYTQGNSLSGNAVSGNSHTGTELDQLFVHLNAAGLGKYLFADAYGALTVYGFGLPHDAYGGAMLVTRLDDADPQVGHSPFMHGTAIVIGGVHVSIPSYKYYNSSSYYIMDFGNNSPAYIPVDVAQAIDTKIDDGLPQSGMVGYAFVPCNYPAQWWVYPLTYSAINCNVTLMKKIW